MKCSALCYATKITFTSELMLGCLWSLVRIATDDVFTEFHETKHQREAANQNYSHHSSVDHDTFPAAKSVIPNHCQAAEI